MIEIPSVNGIIYCSSFQSKILYLLYITGKVMEPVFWADSPKMQDFFFGGNVSGVRCKHLSIPSLIGRVPTSLESVLVLRRISFA